MEESGTQEQGASCQGCQQKDLQLVPKPQSMVHSQALQCHLEMPVVNVAAGTGNGGQVDISTTILATTLGALRMDESCLVAGMMQLTYYILICLSYCIVPPSLVFTLIAWLWCMTYLFSHSTCLAHQLQHTKLKSTKKSDMY